MNAIDIYRDTTELINIVTAADRQYNDRRETKEKGDFQTEVKPFADHAHRLAYKWRDELTAYMMNNPKKNLHPNQIRATAENIELLTVQCFFPETSYNRYKSYIQSSYFVLEQVEEWLRPE